MRKNNYPNYPLGMCYQNNIFNRSWPCLRYQNCTQNSKFKFNSLEYVLFSVIGYVLNFLIGLFNCLGLFEKHRIFCENA